jgi:hypothetical protein
MDSPSSKPIRMAEQEKDCGEGDASEARFSQYTSNSTPFSLEFCFKPMNDGSGLIPVLVSSFTEAGQLLEWLEANEDKKGTSKYEVVASAFKAAIKNGNENKKGVLLRRYEPYSTEVSNYTKEVADNFKLSKEDEDWIDEKVWTARWKELKECYWHIVGIAFLFIFSWCVGWVVRGFAGIPLGMDRKPDDM